MASGGYYNQQHPPPPNSYSMQPPQDGYYNGSGNNQTYNNGYGNPQQYQPPPGPPPPEPKQNGGYGAPPTFDQAFSVQKPKWNDLWAGILFLATCAGFVAVSGIAIQGYGGRQPREEGLKGETR